MTIAGSLIVDLMIQRNSSKSFIVHEIYGQPYTSFYKCYKTYLAAEADRLQAIAAALLADYDPDADYIRERTYSETANNERLTTYGRTDSTTVSDTDTVTYNSHTTNDVVTYDDTLRDQSKSTHGGTDSSSGSSTSTRTAGGSDGQSDDGSRDITETVSGSNNKIANLRAYIELHLQHDLADYLLCDFERRYLFYAGWYYDD